MPTFQAPKLDDRSYDDLRQELVRRIPAHSPEWTDHNASDPGIALVELFAWLGSNLLYRLNRIPDVVHLEFLNLLGIPPRAATPARTMVVFAAPAGEVQTISVGTGAQRPVVAAGAINFQLPGALDVLPLEPLPVVKAHQDLTGISVEGADDLVDLLAVHLGWAGSDKARLKQQVGCSRASPMTSTPSASRSPAGWSPSASTWTRRSAARKTTSAARRRAAFRSIRSTPGKSPPAASVAATSASTGSATRRSASRRTAPQTSPDRAW
jgi:hypothetical protein